MIYSAQLPVALKSYNIQCIMHILCYLKPGNNKYYVIHIPCCLKTLQYNNHPLLPENHVIKSNTSPAAFKSRNVYAHSLLLPNHGILLLYTLCVAFKPCVYHVQILILITTS